MDGPFVGMEDLEAFLAQDSLNYWPVNAAAGSGVMGSSFDEWWDLHQGFESDLFTPFEVNGSGIGPQHVQDLARLPSYSLQEQDIQQGQQLLMEHIEQDHQQQQQKASPQGYQDQQTEQHQEEEEEVEEEEEEEGEGESDGKKHNMGGSRNLVFERKRRKRLNQQLMTLRSLVPNITKMDKRSILVDALGYLQNVLQETEKKMEELNLNTASSLGAVPSSSSSSSSSGEEYSCTAIVEDEAPPVATATQECDRYALVPTVTKMEACMLDEERFLLKISCNKAVGAVGLVQKAIEMLGLQVTCASVDQLDHVHMLTTTFLRVRKKGAVTEEKLLQQLRTNATNLGLLL